MLYIANYLKMSLCYISKYVHNPVLVSTDRRTPCVAVKPTREIPCCFILHYRTSAEYKSLLFPCRDVNFILCQIFWLHILNSFPVS